MEIGMILSILLFFGLSTHASQNLENYMKAGTCKKEVYQKLGDKLKNQAWVPVSISEPKSPVYYGMTFRDSRTRTVYKMWTASYKTHFTEEVYGKPGTKVSWDYEKDCKPVQVSFQPKKSNFRVPAGYTDAELFTDVKKNKWGAIYVWTPYMPLSAKGLKNIKRAVASKGGTLKVLLDPKASKEEARKWIAKGYATESDLNYASSVELLSRDLRLHFPVVYLYKNGFISNRSYIGYKEAPMYEAWIDQEFSKLNKEM